MKRVKAVSRKFIPHINRSYLLKPLVLLAILIVTMFFVEVGIMSVLVFLPAIPVPLQVFLDAFLLTIITFPVLYIFFLRPMIGQIESRRESEKRFRAVFDQTFQFMCILNPDGTVMQVNQSALEAGNTTAEEIVGKPFWEAFREFVPNESRSFFQGAVKAACHGKMIRTEGDFETSRGEKYSVDICIKPITFEQGQVVMVILEGHDITHHKRIENDLREEIGKRIEVEEHLRLQTTAVKAAANGIIITNREGMIEWANPALMQMTGYTEDELLQQKMSLLKSGLHAPDFYQKLWGTILSGKTWTGEIVNRRKDGSLYTEEQTITPVLDETGNISRFIAIKQDISERRRSEARIQRQARRAIVLSEILNTLQDVAQDYQPMLDMIVEKTSELLRDACLIRLLSQDGKQLKLTAFHHVEPQALQGLAEIFGEITLPSEVRRDWQVMESGASLFLPDLTSVELDEWVNSNPLSYQELVDLHSLMILPLQIRGQPIGTLAMFRDQTPEPYTQEDLDFVQNIALKAALAVHNVALFQAEQRSRQTAETLGEATLALTKTLKLETIIHTLLDYIEEIVPFDTACVSLLKDESRLVVRAIRGIDVWKDSENVIDLTMNGEENLMVEMPIKTMRSFLISNEQENPFGEFFPPNERIQSWLSVPVVTGEKAIGLLILGKKAVKSFTREQIQWTEAMVNQAAVATQNAWLFEQVHTGRERLQSLSRRLVEIQESERRYVARELHDETGQALTSLMVGLRLLERDIGQPEAVLTGITELKRIVDEVMGNLHRLAIHLRPASLDHLGLIPALRQYVDDISKRRNLFIQFEVVGVDSRLEEELETVLYRTIQEGLTNVIKHANATRVDIILKRRGDTLITIVEDNGVGFDPSTPINGDHLGLFGMRERLELFGGGLHLESTPGNGTTLLVEVPYETQDIDRGRSWNPSGWVAGLAQE